ncbi:hypothetical protein CN277_30665 [Bacillus cereus]|nr:hypothetical protein COM76_27355 [Bacillus cereus]PEC24158.1 hypothetical protein CON75_30700 [Bacillus thuringiensis]PEB95402.1 hypothetical protein CON04_30425 [Bacillus cereus]PEC88199.1 hypothetical protein CON02_26915 [Bacillus cereus]PEE56426.1 hypothetical protein COM68_24605 [Bacillus cereus]
MLIIDFLNKEVLFLDYEQIKSFLSVANHRHFTKAADELHVTQSTITTRIKNLERYYEQPLFYRSNKRVELSDFGKKILPMLERQLDIMEKTKDIAKEYITKEKVICLGLTYSLWNPVLVKWVEHIHTVFGNIHFKFITDHSPKIMEGVKDGSIDIGIVYHAPLNDNIKIEIMGYDCFSLYGASSFHINERLNSNNIINYPIVYLDWGRTFDDWFFREFGESFTPFVQVGHSKTLLDFVKSGQGIAFIPDRIVESSDGLEKVHKLAYDSLNLLYPQEVYLIAKSTALHNEAIRYCIDTLKKYLF